MKRSDFFEVWIKALESGKYKQGTGSLVEDGKYCCLGVACAEAQRLGILKTDRSYKNRGYLPSTMIGFLGIADNGNFKDYVTVRGEYFTSLAQMNDRGVGFKTIAKVIRKQRELGNL